MARLTEERTRAERPTEKRRCPHCNRRRKVMPSGMFELHSRIGRFSRKVCRGSGAPATATRDRSTRKQKAPSRR